MSEERLLGEVFSGELPHEWGAPSGRELMLRLAEVLSGMQSRYGRRRAWTGGDEAELLAMRYGFAGHERRTLAAIADEMGVSYQAVQLRVLAAVRYLRKHRHRLRC